MAFQSNTFQMDAFRPPAIELSLADSFSASESHIVAFYKLLADTPTLSDFFARTSVFKISLGDTSTVADSQTKSVYLVKSDTTYTQDANQRALTLARSFGDAVVMLDSATVTRILNRTFTDSVTISEAQARAWLSHGGIMYTSHQSVRTTVTYQQVLMPTD